MCISPQKQNFKGQCDYISNWSELILEYIQVKRVLRSKAGVAHNEKGLTEHQNWIWAADKDVTIDSGWYTTEQHI